MKHLYLLLLLSAPINAAIVTADPNRACGILRAKGYSTGTYKHSVNSEYFCISGAKELNDINNAFAKKNTLTFAAYGSSSEVKKLSLSLFISNQAKAEESKSKLVDLAKLMLLNGTFEVLPLEVINAINSFYSLKTTVGQANIDFSVETLDNGISYGRLVIY